MEISDLRNDLTIIEWLDNLGAVESTAYTYLQGMKAFTDFTTLSPEALRTEAEDEILNGILPSRRKIKARLIGFRKSMIDLKLADHTVKSRMTGVRSFYDSFEIDLPRLKGEKRRARTKVENEERAEKADIQKALEFCDPLEKAIMLVGVSSGLASNEIINLKIRDFRSGVDEKTGVTTLGLWRGGLRREKTGVDFVSFLSTEATNAVKVYLEYRNRDSRAPTARRKRQLEKQRVTTENGYLFILRQIDDSYVETKNEELRKLTDNAIQKLYRSISGKMKKDSKKGVYNPIRSHNMRKFFNSAMLNAGADSFFVEFLMGHAIDDTRAAYFRADAEKLKVQYLKYMHLLTITDELRLADNQSFIALQQENEKLSRLHDIVEQQQKRIDEIQESNLINLEIFMNAGTSFESIKDKGLIEKIRKAVKDKEEGDRKGSN
jgi:integrase